MKHVAKYFAFLAMSVSVLLAPSRGAAQYMYLDSNGNGIHDGGDRLNSIGDSTLVDIYLNTNTNRDGSAALCKVSPGTALTINSYAFNLSASGGTVAYGNYINRQATAMPNQAQVLNPGDGVSYKNGFYSFTFIAAGLYRLGTLTITGTSGTPRIDFVDLTTGSVDFTSFGSQCPGQSGDNTLKLGHDWLDSDGMRAPLVPPDLSAPTGATGLAGIPFTLTANATSADEALPIALSATGFPQSLGFSATDSATTTIGQISGTPLETDIGHYTVVWVADDGVSSPVTVNTDLDIIERLVPPIVVAPDSLHRTEGDPIQFVVYADDVDNHPIYSLTADLSNLPAGHNATFTVSADHTEGTFRWTPGWYDSDSRVVTFTASNGYYGSSSTTIHVANAPPPAPQVISTRLQLPGPAYKVIANFFLGLAHAEHTYYSADSGQIYLPLQEVLAGHTYWVDSIHLDFPGETSVAYIRLDNGNIDALAPSVNWTPVSTFPGYNYTPAADPTHVFALNLVTPVYKFYSEAYGVNPDRVGITRFWTPTSQIDIYYDNAGRFIHWPASLAVYIQDQGNGLHEWAMAHEFAHHVQSYVYDPDPAFCPGEGHGVTFCDSVACRKTAWDEGMADGMADYYDTQVLTGSTVIAGHCGGNRSANYEFANADFIYNLSRRDPRAFMDTWRNASARFTPPDLPVRHKAITAPEFYALWNDVIPEGDASIATHHPGPFSIDYEFNYYIHGLTGPTGVEAEIAAESTPGVRRISPNPASRSTDVYFSIPSGQKALIEVLSVTGRLVRRTAFTGSISHGKLVLDVGELASGIYFVRIRSESGALVGSPKKLAILN